MYRTPVETNINNNTDTNDTDTHTTAGNTNTNTPAKPTPIPTLPPPATYHRRQKHTTTTISATRLVPARPPSPCPVPSPTARLVGRNDALLQSELLVDGVKRHERDGRGAVGVGDELLTLASLHVNLGDDERHVGVHPPRRRVVDHDGAGLFEEAGRMGGGSEA